MNEILSVRISEEEKAKLADFNGVIEEDKKKRVEFLRLLGRKRGIIVKDFSKLGKTARRWQSCGRWELFSSCECAEIKSPFTQTAAYCPDCGWVKGPLEYQGKKIVCSICDRPLGFVKPIRAHID